MVRFILYASRLELFSKEISHIQTLLMPTSSEVLITDNKFKFLNIIAASCKEENAAILFVSTVDELNDLVEMKKQICPIPTVLVLPDDHVDTLQKGMLLSPLYFMAKHAEFRQFSLAINELCSIYENYSPRAPHHSEYSFS